MAALTLTFKETKTTESRTSVVKELIAACMALDVMKVYDLIEDDEVFKYTDDKFEVLAELRGAFDKCREEGITELFTFDALCQWCFPKSPAVGFKDCTGAKRFGLVFYPSAECPELVNFCKKNTEAYNLRRKGEFFLHPALAVGPFNYNKKKEQS